MKKATLLIWIVPAIMFTTSCQQSKPKSESSNIKRPLQKSDSLIISDSEFQNDPFGFGDKPLSYLMVNFDSRLTIDSTEYLDEGDNGKVKKGSIYRLENEADNFLIYKRLDGAEFMTFAQITSGTFPTRHAILIGMTKSEMMNALHRDSIQDIPRILIVGNLEYSYFVFEFNADRLKEITYIGYLD